MVTWIKVLFGASLALVGGVGNALTQPNVMQSVPPQAAIVGQIVFASPLEKASPALAPVTPDLLPTVALRARPKATTIVIAAANVAAVTKPIRIPPSVPTSTAPPIALTAQSFLAATNLSLTERPDGPYEVRLATNLGAGQTKNWDLSETPVSGGASSSFGSNYTCTPAPLPPLTGNPDQNPIFTQRTSYTCTISLTPLAGADLRTQSRQFTFTVPPGQLIVTPPSSMDTVLKDGENDGGFVFNNEDTQAVTITNLTFDVSYTGLTNVYGPLVLRFVNPATGQSEGDYHLENLPAVAGQQFSFAQAGMSAPVSLTIAPESQKMLPVEILDAHAMSVLGTNPTLTITLRSASTASNNSVAIINSAVLTWGCIVTTAIYDPNATSGPLVSGQACNVGGN